jgi:bacterioferritin-associated ferredoxin
MYVCVCKAVTDHQIHRELDQGARNLRDLQVRLGLGTQCGGCRSAARAMVLEYVREEDVPASLNIPAVDRPLPA